MTSSIEMEQDLAKRLLMEGGTLVFLGVPEGTEFGIDMKSWNTAGDFRGIKMIPPGLHFIHYSAVSQNTGDVAPRVGFMHNFKSKEFLVKMWDKEEECISNEHIREESISRLKSNLLNIDRFLAPYPYDIFQKWKSLSANITDDLAKLLTPECGMIRSALELVNCCDDDRPKGENKSKGPSITEIIDIKPSADNVIATIASYAKEGCSNPALPEIFTPEVKNIPKRKSRPSTVEEKEEELLPHLKPMPGTALRLTSFPDRNYPEDATPSEITHHCLDQTYVLDIMIKRHSRPIDIIGELEFTFVCFLIGHSLDAFEQWKKLVTLLCSCEKAIIKHRNVYFHFITSLETQIQEIPEEFLADIVMNNNVIYIKLREFFRTVIGAEVEGRLKIAIERFKINLTDVLMWDFSHLDKDDDDEKPVIVKLPLM